MYKLIGVADKVAGKCKLIVKALIVKDELKESDVGQQYCYYHRLLKSLP
jgi:hypothetical protein